MNTPYGETIEIRVEVLVDGHKMKAREFFSKMRLLLPEPEFFTMLLISDQVSV